MDVSSMDLPSARAVVELELEDINESLHSQDATLLQGQAEGFQARRDGLLAQLERINASINDIGENDKECEAPHEPQDSDEQHDPAQERQDCKNTLNEQAQENDLPVDVPQVLCVICQSYVPTDDFLELKCEPEPHNFCMPCFDRAFKIAMHDDISLFPPRCCDKPLPIELHRDRVSNAAIKQFDIRVEELSAIDPTHCSDPQCAKYIQDRHIERTVGTCIYCGQTTCTVCKGKEHKDELCPQDEGTILLKKEADEKHWRQCNNCRNMIELERGCYHITCRCLHQFCYLCGAQWKTCACPQWAEVHIVDPAAPDVPVAAAAPAVHMEAGGDHEHEWSREYGPDCDDCGADHLPWVLQCQDDHCRRASCMRCLRDD